MNTQLEKLFKRHDFSQKDRYDFMQIYSLLPNFKKVRVVENFEEIVTNIGSLKKDMILEQEILFGNTLQSIESKLQGLGRDKVSGKTKRDIATLRDMI